VTVTFADGQRCRTAINLAVAFKGETDRATAERLARAMLEHDGKLLADARLARVAAEAAKAATERMEIANAEVEAQPDGTGRVDRAWFAALNDVAGLRAPSR
jgi:lauroyl/myristoyl acyltransferase